MDRPDSTRLPSAYAGQILEELAAPGRSASIARELHRQRIVPDQSSLGVLLDVAFFASLTREEGWPAHFSLSLAARSAPGIHCFLCYRKLEVESLRKLSAACHENMTTLLVAIEEGEWVVWGVGLNPPPLRRGVLVRDGNQFLTLTVRDAGSLELRHGRDLVFSFARGRGVLPPRDGGAWIPEWIEEALSVAESGRYSLALHHLSCIDDAMHAHKRGGALLVVPSAPPATIEFSYGMFWSIDQPLIDGTIASDSPLAWAAANEQRVQRKKPVSEVPDDEFAFSRMQRLHVERTDSEAMLIGRLTAVDGIVVMNHAMSLRGFGGKIAVPEGFGSDRAIVVDRDSREESETTVGEAFSGMRHKSAAAACISHGPGALGLVRSQDGPLTLIRSYPGNELHVIKGLDGFARPWDF